MQHHDGPAPGFLRTMAEALALGVFLAAVFIVLR